MNAKTANKNVMRKKYIYFWRQVSVICVLPLTLHIFCEQHLSHSLSNRT